MQYREKPKLFFPPPGWDCDIRRGDSNLPDRMAELSLGHRSEGEVSGTNGLGYQNCYLTIVLAIPAGYLPLSSGASKPAAKQEVTPKFRFPLHSCVHLAPC